MRVNMDTEGDAAQGEHDEIPVTLSFTSSRMSQRFAMSVISKQDVASLPHEQDGVSVAKHAGVGVPKQARSAGVNPVRHFLFC